MAMTRQKAVLFVGPTGSGKTPLGDFCQEKGVWGMRCHHFDFGAILREIEKTGIGPASLTKEDTGIINDSLQTGALLGDEHFHIARSILTEFMYKRKMNEDDLLLLNGLPRHVGQARDVDRIIDLKMIVYLHCSPETVQKRILSNSGGDRSGRVDDSLEAVENKLRLFRGSTFPMIGHYRLKKIAMDHIEVGVHTSPEEIQHRLDMGRYPCV